MRLKRFFKHLFAAAALLLALGVPPPGAAQTRRGRVNPCVETLPSGGSRAQRLVPRDEASSRPDFVEFRRMLLQAVRRQDVEAVLAVVHPTARVAFDGSGGPDAFRKLHIDNPDEDFWTEFADILQMGGRFRTPTEFDAPYVFAFWPDDVDSFECLAVTGSGVRLRERPTTRAPIVAALSYVIVERLIENEATPGWQRVRDADGHAGFMAARYLRSPVDHRAMFSFQDDGWWLMAYVSGD